MLQKYASDRPPRPGGVWFLRVFSGFGPPTTLFPEQRLVALAQKEWVSFLQIRAFMEQTMAQLISTIGSLSKHHLHSALAGPNLWAHTI